MAGTTTEMEVPASPGLRRRRSRVPSEEDDKLINYLVAGGHDGSRERNLSVGHVSKLQQKIGKSEGGCLNFKLESSSNYVYLLTALA